MSRYYFHLWTGVEYEKDDFGIEFKNADTALLDAFHSAQEMSVEVARQRQDWAKYRFDIVDESGHVVHELTFSEAMGKRQVKNLLPPDFAARAERGRKLSAELAQEIERTRKSLLTFRELCANPSTSARPS